MLNNVFRVRVRADWACFTRPEFRSERLSYEMMTPAVARNLLQSVTWKPEMQWIVTEIAQLAPVRWQSMRRNEVDKLMGKHPLFIEAEGVHTQRHTLALRNVDYIITAAVALADGVQATDTCYLGKYIDIAQRRLSIGQHFQKPYAGCREMTADVDLVDERTPAPLAINRKLGIMHYDFDYSCHNPSPLFFHAELRDGRMAVPHISDVIHMNRGAL